MIQVENYEKIQITETVSASPYASQFSANRFLKEYS